MRKSNVPANLALVLRTLLVYGPQARGGIQRLCGINHNDLHYLLTWRREWFHQQFDGRYDVSPVMRQQAVELTREVQPS